MSQVIDKRHNSATVLQTEITDLFKSQTNSIIYETTPEGDIRSVVQNEGYDDFASFTARLKDSWDKGVYGVSRPKTRHKKDLSVQFTDISISGEGDNEMLNVKSLDDLTTESETLNKIAVPQDFCPSNPKLMPMQQSACRQYEERRHYLNHRQPSFLTATDNEIEVQLNGRSLSNHPPHDSVELQHSHLNSVHPTFGSLLKYEAGGSFTSYSDVLHPTAEYISTYPDSYYPATEDRRTFIHRNAALSQYDTAVLLPLHQQPPIVPRMLDNRKHRRELSGRSNPAMAHRRTNSSGDSEPTKGNEIQYSSVMASIDERISPTPPSPKTAMPPPSGFPAETLRYSHQSQRLLYSYASNDSQEETYHNSSSQSDAGASYNESSTLFTPGYSMYSQSALSSSTEHYPGMIAGSISFPPHQPLLNGFLHRELRNHPIEPFTMRMKPGEGLLSDNSANNWSHHRKQSSFGSFLATAQLLEEVLGDGYNSAPEGFNVNNESASSPNFFRSLSNDNFMKHFPSVVGEDLDSQRSPRESFRTNFEKSHVSSRDHHDNSVAICLPAGRHMEFSLEGFQPHALSENFYSRHRPELAQKQMSGGESSRDSTRNRRKCALPDCQNRVVQGGLCIAHGAKRKTCNFPECTKNVKRQGRCSTHGPQRKKCEAEGCSKVAVQGGRCISHGAKKKGCSVEACTKQGIMGGKCKKHFDEASGVVKVRALRKKKDDPVSNSQSREKELPVFQQIGVKDKIISNSLTTPLSASSSSIKIVKSSLADANDAYCGLSNIHLL